MAVACWTATAPGKLMLLGEHGVLYGVHALVAAVDARLRLRLRPRADRRVRLHAALGNWEGHVDSLRPEPPFRFVLQVLAANRDRLPGGCDIEVVSDFPETVGLGSSAAVTVAAVGAVHAWTRGHVDRQAVLAEALAAVRAVQGGGSGADLAAAVFGGLLCYRAEPRWIEPLPALPPLTVAWSGAKETTPDVIAAVAERRRLQPARYATIFAAMDRCSRRARDAARRRDWTVFGRCCNDNQDLMTDIEVSNAHLDRMVAALRADPGILGAKISGAGLGDCVVGIGTLTAPGDFPYRCLDVRPGAVGLTVEPEQDHE